MHSTILSVGNMLVRGSLYLSSEVHTHDTMQVFIGEIYDMYDRHGFNKALAPSKAYR